jgi:hypothetical protein
MSKIELLTDEESNEFEKIMNLPIRAATDYYLLSDIKSSEDMNERYVNLIFAIRKVSEHFYFI